MRSDPNRDVTYFARTNSRNQRTVFGIRRRDRGMHVYLIGKTGTGKTSLLHTFLTQDIAKGEGVGLFDPHGDLRDAIRQEIPQARLPDLIDFDLSNQNSPLVFNPLERVPREQHTRAMSGLLDVFKTMWGDSWGPRLEHILRNVLLTLLEQPETVLGDIPRLLLDEKFRKHACLNVRNRYIYDFWFREYASYHARFQTEAISPVLNKVGAFLANPILNKIFSKPQSSFDVRGVLDSQKILLVNLAKGKIGSDSASLLGGLLLARLSDAALSRADTREDSRKDFYLYLDEFPTFTTPTLAGMLSELRKYRLNLTMAHQFLSQLDEPVREAILGNVGTIISFRIGLTDAEVLEKEFHPKLSADDLISLPNHSIYLKLMVDGVVEPAFSAETLQPVEVRRFVRDRNGLKR